MRFVIRSIYILGYEEDQDRAGQTESPVRDLVGGMEERCEGSKLRAVQSVHESFGFAEAIPASIGIR